jgi:hypothetical protein
MTGNNTIVKGKMLVVYLVYDVEKGCHSGVGAGTVYLD